MRITKIQHYFYLRYINIKCKIFKFQKFYNILVQHIIIKILIIKSL